MPVYKIYSIHESYSASSAIFGRMINFHTRCCGWSPASCGERHSFGPGDAVALEMAVHRDGLPRADNFQEPIAVIRIQNPIKGSSFGSDKGISGLFA